MPAPFLLCGFPRMAAHLRLLEGAVGGVGLALHLQTEGASDRMAELRSFLDYISEVRAACGPRLGALAI